MKVVGSLEGRSWTIAAWHVHGCIMVIYVRVPNALPVRCELGGEWIVPGTLDFE